MSTAAMAGKVFVVVRQRSAVATAWEQLEPGRPKMIPLEYRVPVSAEMSTAHLLGTFRSNKNTATKDLRFKVKAIEDPLFFVEFSIKNDEGEEIPGLVARLTPVKIHASVRGPRPGVDGLTLRVKVLSRRDTIKEFDVTLDSGKSDNQTVIIKWMTPPIDMVTGYYLDAILLQGERALPSRAVEIVKRQFTVY